MTERVVAGQEVPAVAALLGDLARGTLCERIRVVAPLRRRFRTGLAGEFGGRRTGDQQHLAARARNFLSRQRNGRTCHVGNGIDAFGLEPLAADRGRDVRLVLVIRGNNADRLAEHLAAEIVDRHLRRFDRVLADQISEAARMIGQHADLHGVVRHLRLRRTACHQHGRDRQSNSCFHDNSLPLNSIEWHQTGSAMPSCPGSAPPSSLSPSILMPCTAAKPNVYGLRITS